MATDPLREFPSSNPASPHPTKLSAANECELLDRLKLQDQLAIEELYDRYSTMVFAVAYHILHDEGAAEDVTQEVFLQLWRNPSSFNPSRGSFSTWLTVISRRRAIDRYRRRREIDVSDVVIPIDGKQYGEAQRRKAGERLDYLFMEMPAHLRSILQMAYIEGLTHSEINARTGEPLGTVKSRIRLGLEWIRQRMDGAKL